MADRLRIVHGVLPPGWPEAARILTVALGVGLIWLSRSLAQTPTARLAARGRGRRRVGRRASREGPRLRGGDDLAAAARRARPLAWPLRRARRPGERPAAARRSARARAAIAAVAGGAELRGVELPAAHRPTRCSASASSSASSRSASGCGRSATQSRRRSGSGAWRARSSSATAATASPSSPCAATRATSSRRRGARSSPTASWPATALVSGDPVGDEAEIDALLARVAAHRARARLAARGRRRLRARISTAIARSGSSRSRSGRRRCCVPQEFSLEGRAIRKVRQSVSRLRKAGYSFRVVAAEDVDPALEAELEAVSAAWRGGQPERGFSMAIDDLHVPGTVLALAEDADGRVGGFLHLAPSPARRRLVAQRDAPPAGRAERPDGVPRRRDARVGERRRARASSRSTSARCTDFLSPERVTTPVRSGSCAAALLLADNVFQLERLYSFNRKFFPEWRRALHLRRALHRPARGRARVSPRRVAARAAGAVDAEARIPPPSGHRQTRRVAFPA